VSLGRISAVIGTRKLAVFVAVVAFASAALQGQAQDFERARRQQAKTDETWRVASDGYMRMEKISYRSRAGDLDIPAFVFQPLDEAPRGSRPSLVWVHEDIRGHLYEHYIPYIREATARGYVVIAPEYRGSIGYGQTFYDAIDYGGREVEDVVTAVDVLRSRYRQVDPGRIGIIGWSHGGLITLLSIFRNPKLFDAAAAIVPVTNLLERLDRKGVEKQLALIDPANRFGGPPSEQPEVYKERSPLFQIDRLRIPLLVHVARNDEDVNIEEDMPLVEALRAAKPLLAVTKVYDHPAGGHTFDRRVNMRTWLPENTPEQRDSWTRIWRFLERSLGTPQTAN
jgi:dipeptidyl aminopeptidase/acylaminoacyl peptidase